MKVKEGKNMESCLLILTVYLCLHCRWIYISHSAVKCLQLNPPPENKTLIFAHIFIPAAQRLAVSIHADKHAATLNVWISARRRALPVS